VSARRWLPGLVTALALALAACGADGPGEGTAPVREQRFVEYDDVRIEVLAEGIGMPVVLLPSLGRDSYDYDDIAEGLAADGFRVLRPIPRGMGGSTGPMQDLTLHDFARDVAAVVEHEGAGPAVLVGHAYGHFVARMTAADRPDLVRGVVCAACAARSYPDSLSKLVVVAADPQRPDAERLDALRGAFFAPGNDPTEWLTGWHPEIRTIQREASDRTNKDEWWDVAPSPILDLQGGADPWRPETTRNELKERFGDLVEVVVIPDASHAFFPEKPREIIAAVTAWARGLRHG
jgi:pimeloyl-ACP methyl ester carboxylesterase